MSMALMFGNHEGAKEQARASAPIRHFFAPMVYGGLTLKQASSPTPSRR
jgi:hypothetical protein